MSDMYEDKAFRTYCEKANMAVGSNYGLIAWDAWKASRESIEVNLPQGGYFAGYDNEHMMESRDVRDAIEEAGIKVKP